VIKLVYCVRKRDDVSDDRFHQYWLEQHGPLVRSFAEAIHARRYVQSHTIAPEVNAAIARSRGLAAPFEGVTEVWWDNLATYRAGFETPEGRQARDRLIADESTFIDFSRSCSFLTEEHVIFDE
jgi:uncharacterized protein (TIGR02118 family)